MPASQLLWNKSNTNALIDSNSPPPSQEGFILIDKSPGKSSFYVVKQLRRITGVKKIGHAGTLDPFASGLLILLIGKNYTRQSDSFLNLSKEYHATLFLGKSTDTYDIEGQVTTESSDQPSLEALKEALSQFQGYVWQTPPMYSAKKMKGKKLYELARQGIVVERPPVQVFMHVELLRYEYPWVELQVSCSKGTYIRSLANDLGVVLGCGAFLQGLRRTKIGPYTVENCPESQNLDKEGANIQPYIQRLLTHNDDENL